MTRTASGTRGASGPGARLADAVRTLPPACFAMVMATGVIAVGSHMILVPVVPEVLGALNVGAYLILWTLTIARLVRYRKALLADLTDHGRGPGFFTIVAATGVLGSQFIVLYEDFTTAAVLWVLTAVLWAVLTFVIFAALTTKQIKPDLAKGISGGWLLSVVATQSVVVLAMGIAPVVPADRLVQLTFLALSMWLWGGMLYVWLMALIFYRSVFYSFSPRDLAPPYWINMGAMAISTLAGTMLVVAGEAGGVPLLASLEPVLKGVTILFWATGTWWIPMLVVLGGWRHGMKRFPFRYDAAYWGMVFPLGMYALCTHHLTAALDLSFLAGIARWFEYAAIAAWVITMFGLLRALVVPGAHGPEGSPA